MRSLVSDSAYFEFLDGMAGGASSVFLVSVCLIEEFPNLKREEAKAVYLDWKSTRLNRVKVTGAMTQSA